MRLLRRLVVVAAVLGVGYLLFGEGPRDVVLVYDLASAPDATGLEVELRRGEDVVRRAEFRVPRDGGALRHRVKLPGGEYTLGWRLTTPGGPRRGERALVISEPGTIVLALGG
jgi:hypothetical protein